MPASFLCTNMHQVSSRRNSLFLLMNIPWLSIILVGRDKSENCTRKNQSNYHKRVAPQKKKEIGNPVTEYTTALMVGCSWYRSCCVIQILLW